MGETHTFQSLSYLTKTKCQIFRFSFFLSYFEVSMNINYLRFCFVCKSRISLGTFVNISPLCQKHSTFLSVQHLSSCICSHTKYWVKLNLSLNLAINKMGSNVFRDIFLAMACEVWNMYNTHTHTHASCTLKYI